MNKNKKRLFEVMSRLDKTFPLNEENDFNSNEQPNNDIVDSIIANPENINKFIDDLNNLESTEIFDILKYQPQLIDDLDHLLKKLDGKDILNLIIYQPKLRDVLKHLQYKIPDYELYDILRKKPEFFSLFDDVLADESFFSDTFLVKLINDYPKLKHNSIIRNRLIKTGLIDIL